MTSPMLYFAYGSNMLSDQMRGRCPSATFSCIAALGDHRLAFTRTATGTWRGFGVADVVPHAGESVWGVVFRIQASEIDILDRKEGYRLDRQNNAYRRIKLNVRKNGEARSLLSAHTYVVCEREDPHPLPHRDYVARIIAGAIEWNLPAEYVRWLDSIEVGT
jgi:cation transport regulator ChaC